MNFVTEQLLWSNSVEVSSEVLHSKLQTLIISTVSVFFLLYSSCASSHTFSRNSALLSLLLRIECDYHLSSASKVETVPQNIMQGIVRALGGYED